MRSLTILAFASALAAAARAEQPPAARPSAVPLTERYGRLIPALIEPLGDTDAEVRQYAAIALAQAGPKTVQPLIEALKDKNRDRRAAAAYALGQTGTAAREA